MKKRQSINKYFKLAVLMDQVSHALLNARRKDLVQYGISTMEAAIIYIIKIIGGNPTPAEISRWVYRAPHTIISSLDRMEKKGLITRNKNPKRKNGWIITLTEKGEDAYRKSTISNSIYTVMSNLSENECEQLESYLRRLRGHAIREALKAPSMPFP